MKQFNLNEYLLTPNRQVVTRDGKKVRIVCTDRAGLTAKPIVALITLPNGDEVIKTFWDNGIETAGSEYRNDLFFAVTKRTDYINLYRNEFGYFLGDEEYSTEEEAKRVAARAGDTCITTIKLEREE